MTRFLTDDEMQKIQNMDKNILKNNFNHMSKDDQNTIVNAYTKTKKFGGWQDNSNLQGFGGFDKDAQIGIPGVNMVKTQEQSQNIQKPEIGESYRYETPKTEIKGLDYVKFKDEPNGEIELNESNWDRIMTKSEMGEKLNDSEKRFLAGIKVQRSKGRSFNDILGIEGKYDKEAKYKNLAMENRNLRAKDLRNNLASSGLNYDEVEKVIGYHQQYDQLLIEEEKERQMDEDRLGRFTNLLQKQFNEFEYSARKRGQERMNVLNTGMSFTGFGRSSYALGRRDEVIHSINSEISKQQALMQSQIAEKIAELQGADSQVLSELRKQTMQYTEILKNQQTENAKLAQALNDEANASMSQALDNMIALSGVNENEIDKELSKELGFLANKRGQAVNIDENGKPIMLLSGRKQEFEEGKEDRDFMYKTYKDDRDFNFDVYKDERNFGFDKEKFAYGMQKDMMDYNLEERKFAHNASVDNNKLQIDWGKLGLEKEKLSYEMEKDALDYELKKAEKQGQVSKQFIEGNQKLFDDIRADTKDFSEINRQYSIMKNAWNAYKTGDKSNKATVEQQLIMVFNKMLDPGSVVREGEFDRTAQGQAIIARFEEQVKRLNQGGAGISDKVLEDLVNGAEIMFNSGKSTMMSKKDNLKANAVHLGADPTFVDSYFNRELGITSNSDEDDIEKMWNSKKTTTTYGPVKPEKITGPLKINFKQADQTAINKGNENILIKAMNKALASTRKSGQCGAFVNDYCQKLGIGRIMGDSYASKEKHINSKIPQPGSVAVWNPGGGIKQYGHTGIVKAVNNDGTVTIIDANWKGDEKVMTRRVPIKTILASAGGGKGGFINFA